MKDTKGDKVVAMNGAYVPQPGRVNEDVVSMLENALERAKAGEFVGGVIVAQYGDGSFCRDVAGGFNHSRMVGHLFTLAHFFASHDLGE